MVADSMPMTLFPIRFQKSVQLLSYFVFPDAFFKKIFDGFISFLPFFSEKTDCPVSSVTLLSASQIQN